MKKSKMKKQKEKAAKRAKYAAYAASGQEKGSKRFRAAKKKSKLVKTYAHGSMNCGNPGCKRCFPHLYIN